MHFYIIDNNGNKINHYIALPCSTCELQWPSYQITIPTLDPTLSESETPAVSYDAWVWFKNNNSITNLNQLFFFFFQMMNLETELIMNEQDSS